MIYLNTVSGDRRDNQEDVIVRVTQSEFRVMVMFFAPSDNVSLTPEVVAGIRNVGIARKMLQDALAALDTPTAG
jgi:hypothetical protein